MSEMQFWKPHDFRETLYLKAFEVADYEFDIGFSEFKMADSIWRAKYFGNPTIFVELCSPGLLGLFDETRQISKFYLCHIRSAILNAKHPI